MLRDHFIMQLKSLELSGFKSFAKRTTVDFTAGVTAIVGPNGSGKSNIVDAIRWVLAEQSFKNLRGKKGEDLIFHGSSHRNALPRARVELTLVNAAGEAAFDAAEVSLAREVKKGGDNTYTINGKSVRLMDLEEFLSRSRVGSGSFRILSQGMSDMLLRLGPGELRSYVEEAAGLKEFQDKKERSHKKIEDAKANLARVGTLLAEITPQLTVLRREVGKFEKKGQVEAALKEVAVALFGYRLGELAKRERVAADDTKRLRKLIEEREKEISVLEQAFEETAEEKDGGNREELQVLRKKDHELSRMLVRLEGQLEVEKEASKRMRPVTQEYVKEALTTLISDAQNGTAGTDKMIEVLSHLIKEIEGGRVPDDNSKELERLQEEHKRVQAQQQEMAATLVVREKEEMRSAQNLTQVKQDILKKEKAYREANEELRELQKQLNAAELEGEKTAVRREQLHHDIEHVGVVTLSEISAATPAKVDEDAIEKELWALKKKRDRIGDIDPAVQKEHEAVSERHAFLTREQGDLERTLVSLETMVHKLEQEIETRFKAAVRTMSGAFNKNLELMFGGGSASLSLTETATEEGDEEDSEGIRITVDLPNKKVKSLGMLSGGERTLVSIALLFALVDLRKPPFLVLDEIDAALDEVNSQKFMKLVAERAHETQFLIITHNRETMRAADALYGVSMREGISQLLSLKLEEAQETATA